MDRTIQAVSGPYLEKTLDLVEEVFGEYKDPKEGKAVRALVEEIRSKRFYLPQLDLAMIDGNGEVIGYAMFSRFHLGGAYEDALLMLTPVAVKTALQRRHISKELLEYGFEKAAQLGYRAVLVEGNPRNYRARGFVTAAEHGVMPGKTVHLPHIECLMIKELVPGALETIHGIVEYDDYKTLLEEGS